MGGVGLAGLDGWVLVGGWGPVARGERGSRGGGGAVLCKYVSSQVGGPHHIGRAGQ
jgi:hypothetical protein